MTRSIYWCANELQLLLLCTSLLFSKKTASMFQYRIPTDRPTAQLLDLLMEPCQNVNGSFRTFDWFSLFQVFKFGHDSKILMTIFTERKYETPYFSLDRARTPRLMMYDNESFFVSSSRCRSTGQRTTHFCQQQEEQEQPPPRREASVEHFAFK